MTENEIRNALHRTAIALAFTSAFAFGCGGPDDQANPAEEGLEHASDELMVLEGSGGSGGFTTAPKCTSAHRSATLFLDYTATGVPMWGKNGPHVVHDAQPAVFDRSAIRYDLRWRRRGTTAWTTINYYGPSASMTTCSSPRFSQSMCVWAEPVTPGNSYEFQQVITCLDGSQTLGSQSCVINGATGYSSGSSCIINVPFSGPYCGDGTCNDGEDSNSCPTDCPKICPKGYRVC